MEYMGICSFMQIPNMVHIVIQKMIQATGNMIEPMLFQLTGVITNFIFDPLLIFGIGFFPAMGIKGAATATVLGYSVSMVLAFIMFLKAKHKIALKTVGFRFEWSIVQKIIILGLPSFIMNALNAFTVTIVNLFLVAYSDTSIAFFGAYFKIQQLIIMTIYNFSNFSNDIWNINYHAVSDTDFEFVYGFGKNAFLWDYGNADYGNRLFILRAFDNDFDLYASD